MEDGIKTFPFPTKLNDKIKMIEIEFGIKGYAVIWKLHQAIYSVGYYLKWDIDAQLLFIDEYRLSEVGRNALSEIVACCIRRGVFESGMYEKYGILTSDEIQETFLTAKERSKKVIMNEDYALPVVYAFIENASKKGKNVNIFFKNADISQQRKGKEKKGKETYLSSAHARGGEEFEERYKTFCEKWHIEEDSNSSYIAEFDFDALDAEYSESPNYLADVKAAPWAHTMSGIVSKYQSIVSGKYKQKQAKSEAKQKPGIIDSWQAVYDKYVAEDEEDDGT